MPRNIERDEKEAMRRKEQLMEAGFRLFSQYGIENVSLQRVADAAEVGVATLYNYYQTKVKLVIAISGKIWGDLWKEILEEKGPEIFESFTAYQYIEFYTDQIIRIYRERKYSGSVITIKTLSPGRKSGGKRWLNIWMF